MPLAALLVPPSVKLGPPSPTEAKNNKRLIFLQLFNSVSNRLSPVAPAKTVTIGTGIDAVSCHLVQGRRSEQEGITYRNKDGEYFFQFVSLTIFYPIRFLYVQNTQTDWWICPNYTIYSTRRHGPFACAKQKRPDELEVMMSHLSH